MNLPFIEEFEDTKVVIKNCKSKKNRQHNGLKNKQPSTKHTHKTKDRVSRTLLKTGGELRCSGKTAKANEMSPDMTLYQVLLDISVFQNKK